MWLYIHIFLFLFIHIFPWFVLAVIQEAWLKELIVLPVTGTFPLAASLTFSLALSFLSQWFIFFLGHAHMLSVSFRVFIQPPSSSPSLSPPPSFPWLRHNNMRAEAQSLVLVTTQQWEHMAWGGCVNAQECVHALVCPRRIVEIQYLCEKHRLT